MLDADRRAAGEWLIEKARRVYAKALKAEQDLAAEHIKRIAAGEEKKTTPYVVSWNFVRAMQQVEMWREAGGILKSGGPIPGDRAGLDSEPLGEDEAG